MNINIKIFFQFWIILLLSVDAVWEDIKLLCDEGIQYGVASVCLPTSYLKAAVEYVNCRIPVCTSCWISQRLLYNNR